MYQSIDKVFVMRISRSLWPDSTVVFCAANTVGSTHVYLPQLMKCSQLKVVQRNSRIGPAALLILILTFTPRILLQDRVEFVRTDRECRFQRSLYHGRNTGSQVVGTEPFLHVFLQFPQNVRELSPLRLGEFIHALQCTIEHPAVQKIHLLQQAKFQVMKELPELRDPDNKVQTRVINEAHTVP